MRKTILATALALGLCAALPAQAAKFLFTVPLSGANEFPGLGDADGTGLAQVLFDAANSTVEWIITIENVALPVAAAHIHMANAGVAGPVRVDFSGQLTGGPLFDADIAAILANPTGWYVNVHNAAFPAGAVRGQLPADARQVPEPATLALLLLGLGGAFAARRRR